MGLKKRQYAGEDRASHLINWLNSPFQDGAPNGEENEAAKKRVKALLGEIAKLNRNEAPLDELREIVIRLNDMLESCSVVPQIQLNVMRPLPLPSKDQVVCSVDFEPAPGTLHDEERFVRNKGAGMGNPLAWPLGHESFMLLIDIWREGNISKIRRCKQCGKFFYEHRTIHDSCSPRCREAFSKSSPEGRRKRNERLRRNYRYKLRKAIPK